MAVSLRFRAVDAVEIMDGTCDPVMLDRTYADFYLVNRVVSGWRGMYCRSIRPGLSTTRPTTLLDVGSGGGDVARCLARWAARDGLRLEVTAIDPDDRAHAWASEQPAVRGLTFRRALSSDLVAEGALFDFVVSNHVVHHLSAAELQGLLSDSLALARRGVLHADIARGRLAYLAFALGTWPFFRGSYIRADGLTSIRRSFTAPELRHVVPACWRVRRSHPYRLEIRWGAPRASGTVQERYSATTPMTASKAQRVA